MTVRERTYRWLATHYGPPPPVWTRSATIGTVSIGARQPLRFLLTVILSGRRQRFLDCLFRLLAPPQPLPDPAVLRQQVFDCL